MLVFVHLIVARQKGNRPFSLQTKKEITRKRGDFSMSSQSQAYLLEGRVAVVTGSSQGIGKVVAIGLSQAGATVLVTGTNPERTKKVTEEEAR